MKYISLILPSISCITHRIRHRVPSNLLSIAASMQNIDGVSVQIIDAESLLLDADHVLDYFIKYNPIAVGISVCSPAYNVSKELVNQISNKLPATIIILGGKHITHCWREVVHECPNADILVIGEGEEAMRSIATAISDGYSKDEVCRIASELPNVITKGKAQAPSFPAPYNLSSAPPRSYDVLYLNLDYYLGDRMLVEFSRGCRGACTYCLAPKYRKGLSYRTAKSVVDEILYLTHKGFNSFFFTDDDFSSSPERLEELCITLIDSRANIQFDANVRPDSLVACSRIASLIRDAGCRCLWLGIESGSEKILKSYAKGFDLSVCDIAIEIAFKAAPIVKTNWLIGAPSESNSTFNETIDYALTLRKYGPHLAHLSYLLPYPGSPLYKSVLDLNLITREGLDAELLITHDKPVMPSIYLTKNEISDLFVHFHAVLYDDTFLNELDTDMYHEAIAILESASIHPPVTLS